MSAPSRTEAAAADAPGSSASNDAAGGAGGWWRRLGRGQRVVVVVLAVVVGANVALAALGGIVGKAPGGPVSSSFGTGRGGLRGWSELLARRGHRVDRLRGDLAGRVLDGSETVVLADPDPGDLSAADGRSLVSFLRRGGRLVLAGPTTGAIAQGLTGEDVVLASTSVGTVRVWVPAVETRGVTTLAGAEVAWSDRSGLLPVAGSGGGDPVVLIGEVGPGHLVAVADASVFQNRLLDRADNAAFALAVVGPRSRPVVFVESVHGYGVTGLAAVPSSWKWALAGLGLALVVGLWSAGARFGGPEPDRRQLRPARRDHVEAVAADLDRVVRSDAEVVAPLVASTRAALSERVGAPADASPELLWARGRSAGLDEVDLAALLQPVTGPGQAQRVGAVAADRQRAAHGIWPQEPARDTGGGTVADRPASGGTSP